MSTVKERFLTLFHNYKHLLLLLYFPVYLIWFAYVEKQVTTHFHVIHTFIDDWIPFCEYFIIPYLLWFGYIAWGVTWSALRDRQMFYRLCGFLFTGMTIFLIISTVYPNGQFLRPIYFSRHNLCTMLCQKLYLTDTATNLFPSIHVYNSVGIHLAITQSATLGSNKKLRLISAVLMVSIILATMFLKQHSAFDVITALILCFIMYYVCYRHDWSKKQHVYLNKNWGRK